MVLSRLRDWRKTVAEKEGVPVSVLLTNEQPTQMVPKQVNSNACLKEIEGVGEGGWRNTDAGVVRPVIGRDPRGQSKRLYPPP